MHVLVTGGAGYIGSHTCMHLLQRGMDVTVIDNFCNSSPEALNRVQALSGRSLHVVQGDVRDAALLDQVFQRGQAIDAVIHFAGLKAVGESVAEPTRYYDNNVAGSLSVIQAMDRASVNTLIFSSTATVYGDPSSEDLPLRETAPCGFTLSPYASSKWMVERCLADLQLAQPHWRIACLRYFNPVGAHHSGRIGENPRGIPNNLVPYISQVALGMREKVSVYGNDYATPDGTGVRDYIHVMDLAEGHGAALDYLGKQPQGTLLTLNLGTGQEASVMDVINTFSAACGRPIPYQVVARRPGDVPVLCADSTLANQLLNWQATRSLLQMCHDSWHWQTNNPRGYDA